jgi:hypothetical protein
LNRAASSAGTSIHPFGVLEPDRPLLGVIDGVHHVDRQTALVEDMSADATGDDSGPTVETVVKSTL